MNNNKNKENMTTNVDKTHESKDHITNKAHKSND
jgi:hypothetical protein